MEIISDLFQKTREEIVAHVNEVKLGGDYKTEFNGSLLSNDVNFYQLKANDPESSSGQGFIETKKMTLIK